MVEQEESSKRGRKSRLTARQLAALNQLAEGKPAAGEEGKWIDLTLNSLLKRGLIETVAAASRGEPAQYRVTTPGMMLLDSMATTANSSRSPNSPGSKVPSLGLSRHTLGNFTDRVLTLLTTPIPVDLGAAGPIHLQAEAFEFGDNPLYEEVCVRFRVAYDPTRRSVPQFGAFTAPIKVGSSPVLDFTFSSEVTIDENLTELSAFVAKFFVDGLPPARTPATTKAFRM
jgi:hypothetical protein